jgi:NAD-dependent dihydropyrimidine dehydrogenase PreA subunit
VNNIRLLKTISLSTILLLAAFALLLTFAAEGVSETKSAQKSQPQYGGTLKIISKFTPVNQGIPSQEVGGDDATYNVCGVETLIRYDQQGKPMPWLATGMATNEVRRCMTCGGRAVITYPEDCMICLYCERDCPMQAIYVSPEKTTGPVLPWG